VGTYLVLDVCETDGKVDGEYYEDDVAFWVAQRSQSIVLLLPCRVPERDLDNLAVELSVCYVVLEHGGYVRLDAFPSEWSPRASKRHKS
jgi:hypothetical protein